MTVKEKIVEGIKGQGFDTMTAFEKAQDVLDKFKASDRKTNRYCIGSFSFTLTKKG
jgi:hypothetical protein